MAVSGFLGGRNFSVTDLSLRNLLTTFTSRVRTNLYNTGDSLTVVPSCLSASMRVPMNGGIVIVSTNKAGLHIYAIFFSRGNGTGVRGFGGCTVPNARRRIATSRFFSVLTNCMRPLLPLTSGVNFYFSCPTRVAPSYSNGLVH